MSINSVEVHISSQEYEEATDILARLSAWQLLQGEHISPEHDLKVLSNYVLGLALAGKDARDDAAKLEKQFTEGLVTHGVSQGLATDVGRDITSRVNLRRIFSLDHIKRDEPSFGLRVKRHMRYLDEPKFIRAVRRLGN